MARYATLRNAFLTMNNERFLNLVEVVARSGLSKTTIYRRIKAKQFPQNINLGCRRVVWLESEIAEWQQQQIERNRREAHNAEKN